MSGLPRPDSSELAHTHRLSRLISDEITASGGWISFAKFMELALYAPEVGYYYNPEVAKFGKSGDFVTAPELSPLFSYCIARQIGDLMSQVAAEEILEVGAGSGVMARDLMRELDGLSRVPEHYTIFETSPDLIQRQKKSIAELPDSLANRVEWINALPRTFSGIIIANEVLDAMPVHVICWRNQGITERGVTLESGEFCWGERSIESGELFTLARSLEIASDYVSEISLAMRYFVSALAKRITHGAMLLIDYGFGRKEFYHPQRTSGTMMCHYRHYSHGDPFFLPGLQDITCHVDFSAVADSAEKQGMELFGYTTQAQFLINCGITQLLESRHTDRDYPRIVSQAQKLLSPSEMGELFKVIALGKGLSQPLLGFTQGDKRRLL